MRVTGRFDELDGQAARDLLRGIIWLAVALVAVKASFLGPPPTNVRDLLIHVRSIAAVTYLDIALALAVWAFSFLGILLAGRRRLTAKVLVAAVLVLAALACLYAVANVVMFPIFGGFLTYPLITLAGNLSMLSSSVSTYLTPGVVASLVGIPLVYLALTKIRIRRSSAAAGIGWRMHGAVAATLAAWVVFGHYGYGADWQYRQNRRLAENSHWVLLSSWWHTVTFEPAVHMSADFLLTDLADFEPIGDVRPAAVASPVRAPGARARAARPVGTAGARRPPNVILVVLESVALRWTSLGAARYETTPRLLAESKHALVFDRFYAHVGRSSNSLGAMLLSVYPRLNFGDLTVEHADLEATSIASLFRNAAYRTTFMTPSDMSWAGWNGFVRARGFDRVWDYRDLACPTMVSSWGVEDRCMVDAAIDLINVERDRPFFIMAWTQQTHHPYEPSPGLPVLDLLREPIGYRDDIDRYLTVLNETDRQLGRLFDAVRAAGLADDTLIVVTGDHGQAFGYPHDSYMQGRTIYEEDVNVPLMIWSPRAFRAPARRAVVGGHVDLAPTIAELTGLRTAADWQGRSLLGVRSPRAYFYVAEDQFRLGVREDKWKYIYDLRAGAEELFDLEKDPLEQRNLAAAEPERCARMRQRLAAWTEANRRVYERASVGRTFRSADQPVVTTN